MPFIRNMDQIRTVEWGSSHLWNVKFMDGPSPDFSDWFPALDVNENYGTVVNHQFQGTYTNYSMPKESQEFLIQLTWIDNVADDLLNWMEKWINQIIFVQKGNGLYTEVLYSCSKTLIVEKLTKQRETLSINTYHVVPDGNIDYQGTATSGLKTYSVTFKVVGSDRNIF